MTLILFREEDKENKVKQNSKNIFNYLKARDLWDMNIYNDDKFNENINKLQNINFQINQILWLYNYLINNKEDDFFFKEVEENIKSKKEKKELPMRKSSDEESYEKVDFQSENYNSEK